MGSVAVVPSFSFGPWGGPGGSPWSYIATDGIKEITLDVGRNIRAISFADAKGFISGTFGGNNPNNIGKEEKITIQWPSEYLTSITGTYGDFNGLLVIYSLSFVTNQKAYGPFGSPSSGQAFSSPPDGNVIVGFHGRSGWYIDAIGIYVQPAPTTSLGPWGGPVGNPWSYIPTDGIKEIIMDVGRNIRAISFADANGFISGKFGGKDPNNIGKEEKITIQWPSEYLTSIKGTFGNFNGDVVIYSLSFITNNKTYGPFGSANSGQAFTASPPAGNVVVGFHGMSGWFIDALGIYVRPVINNQMMEINSKLKLLLWV
ncbi:mannose/glucose-specific lectin isoform X1 [Coffea arabica]|uniref:Mannose/glucose-specific lectin isoform X1 n=1 Tax=Coffea arabica TaxID=13443 RepID=A0ABM4V776_COFAR